MSAEPDFVAATLEWCNEMRAERDMDALDKLPKGYRYDGASCPCGRATGLYVGTWDVLEDEDAEDVICPTPGRVTQFVQAFDHGKLPQYEDAS